VEAARLVATPVLERIGARGAVAGVVNGAAYVELGEFVLALTAPAVPAMPNAIALAAPPASWPEHGAPARLEPGGFEAGAWTVAWPAADPPAWEPALEPLAARPELRGRGEAVLRAAGEVKDLDLLRRALAARDADLAAALVGRGPGLTPEGDDLLAGAVAVLTALGDRSGLLPPRLRERTTPLSATLLELAAEGRVIEPLHALLDLGDDGWPATLDRLLAFGHSTGRAYAAGAATACTLAQ
jgi:hypothetical protein